MELFLNLVWLLLATAMAGCWLRYAPRNGADRRMQLVSLVVLLFILLPAISVTDDLLAAQNPAEVDSCLRRDHDYPNPHSIFPVVAALPLLAFGHISSEVVCLVASGALAEPTVDSPALVQIQNRPPPAA
jgi:hypothetical protein